MKRTRIGNRFQNPRWHWARLSLQNHRREGWLVRMTTQELYQYAKVADFCEDCGARLTWGYGHGQNAGTPSLDRRDNDGAVEINNIAIVCRKCSSGKTDKSMSEWQLLNLGKLRRCITCGKVKTLDQFYTLPPRGSLNRYDSQCKECNKMRVGKYQSKNRAYRNEYQRNWYQRNKMENREKARICQRNWRAKNRLRRLNEKEFLTSDA